MFIWSAVFVLLAVAAGSAYTLYVARYDAKEMWGWLHNAAATLVSLLLALSSGFAVYELQRQHQSADERQQAQKLALSELKRISGILASGERVNVQCGAIKAGILVQYVQPLGIERAAIAESTYPDTAANLAQIANEVRTYNIHIERLFDALDHGCAGANAARLDAAIRSLVQSEQVMRQNIQSELLELESP